MESRPAHDDWNDANTALPIDVGSSPVVLPPIEIAVARDHAPEPVIPEEWRSGSPAAVTGRSRGAEGRRGGGQMRGGERSRLTIPHNFREDRSFFLDRHPEQSEE